MSSFRLEPTPIKPLSPALLYIRPVTPIHEADVYDLVLYVCEAVSQGIDDQITYFASLTEVTSIPNMPGDLPSKNLA
jgi:hypothetical protein